MQPNIPDCKGDTDGFTEGLMLGICVGELGDADGVTEGPALGLIVGTDKNH